MGNDRFKVSECPAPHLLNGYLTKTLDVIKREEIESHVADCPYCLFRISEAHEVLNDERFKSVKELFMNVRKKFDLWLLGAFIMFALSFIVPRYFIQFLVGAVLLGMKWIVDNKNTKMLIMIYDAWKRGGKREAGRILSTLDSKLKR